MKTSELIKILEEHIKQVGDSRLYTQQCLNYGEGPYEDYEIACVNLITSSDGEICVIDMDV